jgi:hypothetical protein
VCGASSSAWRDTTVIDTVMLESSALLADGSAGGVDIKAPAEFLQSF